METISQLFLGIHWTEIGKGLLMAILVINFHNTAQIDAPTPSSKLSRSQAQALWMIAICELIMTFK